jgi:hypothetical protein
MIIMDKYYLTDQLYKQDDHLFFEKNDKNIKLTTKNWHVYLNDYGWNKLNKQWIKKLNSYLERPENNSRFGVLDCGENGDCLFHCISYALNEHFTYDSYDSNELRTLLSENISEEDYHMIIEYYRIFKSCGDFDEDWDLEKINFEIFKKKIKEGGNDYWGDFFMILMLKKTLQINFIILSSNDITKEYYYYSMNMDYEKDNKTVLLLYENENHFKLMGYFQDGKMDILFNDKKLPIEIRQLITN